MPFSSASADAGAPIFLRVSRIKECPSRFTTPPPAPTPCKMADSNKDALRALKIKTGVLTRVRRELTMYQGEVQKETDKLNEMSAAGKDSHDIKQQVRRSMDDAWTICGARAERVRSACAGRRRRSRRRKRQLRLHHIRPTGVPSWAL